MNRTNLLAILLVIFLSKEVIAVGEDLRKDPVEPSGFYGPLRRLFGWFTDSPEAPRSRRLRSQVSCGSGNFLFVLGPTPKCTVCPFGKYQPYPGRTACLSCPAGQYGHPYNGERTTALHCQDCESGHYQANAGQSACVRCPGGKYNDKDDSPTKACIKCAAGRHQPRRGAFYCYACPMGSYEPIIGSPGRSCVSCKKGQTTEKPGAASINKCMHACPVGKFNSDLVEPPCFACPAGKFNQELYRYQCKLCPQGKFQQWKGRSRCEACPYGLDSPKGAKYKSDCKACPVGRFKNGVFCMYCPKGKSTAATGGTSPQDCTVFKAANCPAGQFQEQKASVKDVFCERCPNGKYNTGKGVGVCTSCPAGMTTRIRNSRPVGPQHESDCKTVMCPSGKFNTQIQQHRCLYTVSTRLQHVMEGKSLDVSSGACTGPHCQKGCTKWQMCVTCPAGRYSVENTDVWLSACELCPKGKMVDPTQTKCILGKHIGLIDKPNGYWKGDSR